MQLGGWHGGCTVLLERQRARISPEDRVMSSVVFCAVLFLATCAFGVTTRRERCRSAMQRAEADQPTLLRW
jgi:hypothetical protein